MRFNPVRWLLVLLWIAGILFFSSRARPLAFLFPENGTHDPVNGQAPAPKPEPDQSLGAGPRFISHSTAGQLAHVLEYGGLAALLAWALPASLGSRRYSRLLWALGLSALLALGDEAYQELFPNRGFELADVALDVLGAGVALMVFWWATRRSAQ